MENQRTQFSSSFFLTLTGIVVSLYAMLLIMGT